MEKIGLFVILACLFSCSEQKINMNTSHALPIEFWDIDEDTANEKNVCGVTPVCFCQPRNCSDEISIPLPSETLFTDIAPNDYVLVIKDVNNSIFDIVPFIRNTITIAASFSINYSQFGTGSPTIFIPWNLGDPSVIGNQNPPACASKYLVIGDITGALADYPLTFTVPFIITTIGDNTVTPTYYLYNSDYSEFISIDGASRNSNNTFSDTFTLTPSFIPYHLVVRVSFLGTTTSAKYKLNTTTLDNGFIRKTSTYSLALTPSDIAMCDMQTRFYIANDDSPNTLIKKSDCISFKTSHPCTTLIEYRNATDFDGIENSSSPMTTFNLLIPAIFFEEQNTKEGEDIELSNDEIVRLYDKIEEKRLLQIGFMPHYMHRKLLLALSFDFVTIDGKEWIARDEYKKNDGDRHYPLKTASILLTDKNFIKENQL